MKSNNLIKIGTFRLGDSEAELFADLKLEGGEYERHPQLKITIGFNRNSFDEVVGILLHEAFESECSRRELRYRTSPQCNWDSGDFLFVFNHAQFGRICADVGSFMAAAIPQLAKHYNKNCKRKL